MIQIKNIRKIRIIFQDLPTEFGTYDFSVNLNDRSRG